MRKLTLAVGMVLMASSMQLMAEANPQNPAEVTFIAAKPVWLKGRATEMNVQPGFKALFEAPTRGKTTLRVAAATIYRAFINGEFCGWGPARAGHGFFRVDEWDITDKLHPGTNAIAIEAAGYNSNSYAYLDQPSFLQAEVECGGKAHVATGDAQHGFQAFARADRVQFVERTSFQRPFGEAYRLTPQVHDWRSKTEPLMFTTDIETTAPVKLAARKAPYPRFHKVAPFSVVSTGTAALKDPTADWHKLKHDKPNPKVAQFQPEQLEIVNSFELHNVLTSTTEEVKGHLSSDTWPELAANTFRIYDFGQELTGFVGATLSCEQPARVFLAWDELLTKNDVSFDRMGMINAITIDLEPGMYRFESMEPYSLKYLKIIAMKAPCIIGDVHIRECANDSCWEAQFSCSDDRLNRIFEAARQTFRQNAVDIFMDCPSRERAGWLCDSFFTARSAQVLCGAPDIEHDFLQNFLIPEKFPHLPEGMLPMCYPSDHNDGNFIPNWAMWFVLQLEEYGKRSGDTAMIEAFKPRVKAFHNWCKQYRNSDGLLEKLPRWVFVEWSDANKYVQDVNYPSNMLYAGVLDAIYRMYGDDEAHAEAVKVRAKIREQSFDGEFFVDNALRKEDGGLSVTRNRTETCQYYAFYFDVASTPTHTDLWNRMVNEFGPKREKTKLYPEIGKSNSLIGNVMRLELLSRARRTEQIAEEAVGYHLKMADLTGTMWENDNTGASCNHGFASHISYVLMRDILGVKSIDTVNKRVVLAPRPCGPDWCKGRIPTPDGFVQVSWEKSKDETCCISTDWSAPAGYKVEVE